MSSSSSSSSDSDESENNEDFPWDMGIYDAHCHPTDTMGSITAIQAMRTRTLTIMATRAQDQDLVSQVASSSNSSNDASSSQHSGPSVAGKVVPAFGWHPWFSHQIWDDDDDDDDASESRPKLPNEAEKVRHYQKVLTPAPEEEDFVKSLPDPVPLSRFLHETEQRLATHKHALIGEVGLDKAFRIPEAWLPEQKHGRDETLTPGGREGRRLSRYRVQMAHQRKILTAQLRLAGKMQRAVSIHGVQAHGMLYDTLEATWKGHEREVVSRAQQKRSAGVAGDPVNEKNKDDDESLLHNTNSSKPYPPRICLHSYSGPPDPLKQYLHAAVPVDVYFSFSIVINFSTAAAKKTEEVIMALPGDRILVESDMHIAGRRMDRNLMRVTKKVCDLKGWSLQHGTAQLHKNWKTFVYGKGEDITDDNFS